MKHVKYSANLAEWQLNCLDEACDTILQGMKKAIGKALEIAFEDEFSSYIYFPIESSNDPDEERPGSDGLGGPEVKDPLTVYLRIGIGEDEDTQPTYEFNLRDVLKPSIEECAKNGSYYYGLGKLEVSLRELADDINSALIKAKSKDNGQ